MILVDITIGKNDDINTVPMCTVYFQEQTVDRLLQRSIFIVGNRDHLYLEPRFVHIFDPHQIGAGQNRIIHFQDLAVLCSLLQYIAFLTDIYGRGGHDLLADCIDRRVGYLCKQLFEIVKQRLMFLGKHSQRTVSTHGGYSLSTI